MEELRFVEHPPLMIAYTPLHVLIIERIISERGINKFDLIYFSNSNSPKHRAYYDRLGGTARNALFLQYRRRSIVNVTSILSALRRARFLQGGVGRIVFVAALKQIPTRLILLFVKNGVLHTYDDGWGNVSGEGYYYECSDGPITRLAELLMKRLSYRWLVANIDCHVTIFKGLKNVFGHAPVVNHIDLFPSGEGRLRADARAERLAVLLTAPFSENGLVSAGREREIYKHAIEKFGVKMVIPHPGERSEKLADQSLHVLGGNKIAEEIIGDLVKGGMIVDLYGFASTTLLVLAQATGHVRCHSIDVPDLKINNEIMERLGVKICFLHDQI
ncbi:glycosyltransferase family 52 [Cupriavidus sp. AcVe19-6a]|uniref:glycosyltransferase family 52 n=1 Tax=Cupriavidus sp. AcVe19-6a TaxID=2821358 RepID=UPI001AE1BBDE|nr:glycosyltransferase family 52 [Cupriavidus sp. AcVe19-6a]MBP0640059.1 hypothetical protein [Cupriavidus sp. AcVe19-6a]